MGKPRFNGDDIRGIIAFLFALALSVSIIGVFTAIAVTGRSITAEGRDILMLIIGGMIATIGNYLGRQSSKPERDE